MTPSKQAKAAGLKSLQAMSEATGWPVSTLRDMHENYPQRFKFLVDACVAKNHEGALQDIANKISMKVPNRYVIKHFSCLLKVPLLLNQS